MVSAVFIAVLTGKNSREVSIRGNRSSGVLSLMQATRIVLTKTVSPLSWYQVILGFTIVSPAVHPVFVRRKKYTFNDGTSI